MNLLNELTISNLKLNKKRTIVTIVGIMLSVALITAVATMYSSAMTSLLKYKKVQDGNFHVAFENVPVDEIDTIKNNRKIDKVFFTQSIGYAKLAESRNESKPYAFVKAFSKNSIKNLSVNLVEGRLPENESEIVIPTHLKTNGRVVYNVGDVITLDVGDRICYGEKVLQDECFNPEGNEQIVNTVSKTYTVVGIIERPAYNVEDYSAPGYTFITYSDSVDEDRLSSDNIQGMVDNELKIDVYARFNKEALADYKNIIANMLGVDEELYFNGRDNLLADEDEVDQYLKECEKAKYNIKLNENLIKLEDNPIKTKEDSGLGVVVFILCGIIVVTSVFCIKNSFDISITEKIRQYGMLRSVGATKKQIRKNVLFEATALGLVGVPLGILVGIVASFILVKVSNYYLESMRQELKNMIIYLDMSWIAIIVAIVLGFITVYLSALSSARRAAKVSPIESIRNSANIKIKAKKLKCPKIIKKMFGIGGEISHKNLKRNKRKYRTTVISIVVSVFTFIALTSFMSLAFDIIDKELLYTDYDLELSAHVKDNEEMRSKVLDTINMDTVKDYTVWRTGEVYIKDANYSKEYRDGVLREYNMTDEDEVQEYNIQEDDIVDLNGRISVYAIGEHQYKQYVKQLGLDYESVKDKGIVCDYYTVGKYSEEKKRVVDRTYREFTYNKGDRITYTLGNYKEEGEDES